MKTSSRDEPDLFQHLVEQLPGAADEGQPLAVLFGPGRLADEHQVGVGVTGAKDRLGPRLVQWALGAVLDFVEKRDELPRAAPLRSPPLRPSFCSLALGLGEPLAARGFAVAAARFVGPDRGPARLPPRRRHRREQSPRAVETHMRADEAARLARGQLLEALAALLALELVDGHGAIVVR